MTSRRLARLPGALTLLRGALIALCAAPLVAQLSIPAASFPQATAGKPYQAYLTPGGGAGPFIWWVNSGKLPDGLAVVPLDGQQPSMRWAVFGIPASTGSHTFYLKVRDSSGATAERLVSLVVAAPRLSIATAGPLPAGRVGQTYRVSLLADAGAPPYRWAATTALPTGLTLSPAGILSGVPTTSGRFEPIGVQVTDGLQAVASANFTLIVDNPGVEITTVAPLFSGVVGVAYAQPFAATGGKPPYSWSVSGDTGGLTLDPTTGVLRGAPPIRGTFHFTVRVSDTAGSSAVKDFSVVITPPSLTLAAGAAPPPGAVAAPYNHTIQAIATGGTPPFRWSIAGALPPGLAFAADTMTLSGVPQVAGSFSFALQVSDSSQQTASRSLVIVIAPASLSIAGPRELPVGALNVPYSTNPLAAAGGAPPYTWTAAGLPAGLRIESATGAIVGTPAAAGTFPIAITLSDAALSHVSDRFTLKINLPPAPRVLVSGLPGSADPAEQYSIQVALESPFPAPITGQAVLTFAPESGPADRTVQFASGGVIANFSIPSGSTIAAADVPLAIQTGSVSGAINVSIRLQAGGVDITPAPAPSISANISRAAPVIHDVRVSRSGSGINLVVSGFSTAREVTQATFTFSAASGQTLQPTASSIVVPVEGLFSAWFQDPANGVYGSQFVLTQPFAVQGDASLVLPQAVTLSNRMGSNTYRLQ